MSTTIGGHPIWDAELDGVPSQGAGPTPSGSSEIALRSKRLEDAPVKVSQRLREWVKSGQFAAIVGIVAPVFCLVFDPFVFKGGDEHGAFLGRFWVLGYSLIGLEFATLAAWLASRGRLGPLCGVAAGVLIGGALFAAAVGLLLLPLSLIGLLVVIGILGFTPYLTAYAYLHQGMLALEKARSRAGEARAAAGLSLGLLLAFGLPVTAQMGVQRAWAAAIQAVADGDASAKSQVKYWHWFMDTNPDDDPLNGAIREEPDPVRKERLAQVRD